MAETKDSSKSDKIFDVSKPGKTAASSTSRPVIIGHKSMLKDPMVKDQYSANVTSTIGGSQKADLEQEDKPSGGPQSNQADGDEPGTAPTVSRIKIQPISSKDEKPKADISETDTTKKSIKLQILPAEPESTESEEKPSNSKTTEPVDSDIKDSLPVEETGQTTESENKDESQSVESAKTKENKDQKSDSTASDSAAVNAVANQAETQKKNEKQAQEEETKKATLEKLVIGEKYFVPIGQKTRKKRSLQNTLLGVILILVLGALLADVLLDAGLIHYKNIQPPIRIINR